MKKASLALIMGATLVLSACGGDKTAEEENTANDTAATYTTETEQYSYAMGVRLAAIAKDQGRRQQELGLPGDEAALRAGFIEGFDGASKFSDEEVNTFIEAFSVKYQAAEQAKQAELQAAAQVEQSKNIELSKVFLAENGSREEVTTTDSGLQYEVLTQAEGASPSSEDRVRVHYHGTLVDGTVFDSSVDRGEPTEFSLRGVIPGWTEGLQLMNVGSKYRFYIPSELAYGPAARGPIPASATLIFDVELLAIAPFTD